MSPDRLDLSAAGQLALLPDPTASRTDEPEPFEGLAVECPSCMEVLTLDDVRLVCTGAEKNRFCLACTCGRYIPVEVKVGATTARPPAWARSEA